MLLIHGGHTEVVHPWSAIHSSMWLAVARLFHLGGFGAFLEKAVMANAWLRCSAVQLALVGDLLDQSPPKLW